MDWALTRPTSVQEVAAAALVWGSPYVAAARLRLNRTLPQTPFAPRIATSPGAALNNLGRQRRASDSRYRPGVGVSTDTLYTSAWLDLASGPFLLEVRTIRGRYYSFQFGHSDTSTDLAVGSRTHGEQLAPIVITGPGHEPVGLPEGAMLVRSRTRYLNLPGRMLVDPEDAADLACAHQIQDDIRLRPLDFWRRGDDTVVNPPPDQRSITPPEGLPPELGMLHSLGEVLRDEIIPEPDLQLVEEFARIGLTPSTGFDPDHLTARDRDLVTSGVRAGRELIDEQCRHLGVRSGGWGTNLVGPRFDGDHLLRAAVARDQIYVTVPEEGIYPLARTDSDGVSLDGRRSYRIHFPAGSLPPVVAFWSITLYDDGFLVAEADGRHAVGDRTPGFVRSDGTATLGVGPTAPPDTTAWLPAPRGPFYLMMRLFCPRAEVLDGRWSPPHVEALDACA